MIAASNNLTKGTARVSPFPMRMFEYDTSKITRAPGVQEHYARFEVELSTSPMRSDPDSRASTACMTSLKVRKNRKQEARRNTGGVTPPTFAGFAIDTATSMISARSLGGKKIRGRVPPEHEGVSELPSHLSLA